MQDYLGIKGTAELEQVPSIEELNAILCFCAWIRLGIKAMKVYGKW